MMIESVGTPSLYLGFSLLVGVLLAIDFYRWQRLRWSSFPLSGEFMKTKFQCRLSCAVAICIVLAGSIGARAVEAQSGLAPPAKPDPEAVKFLLAAAAEDFKASGAPRPVAMRKTRVGYFPEAGTGRYVLCGSFRLAAGSELIQFATVKTSPYEHWIGGMAEAQCANKRIKWYGVNYADDLLQRIQGK